MPKRPFAIVLAIGFVAASLLVPGTGTDVFDGAPVAHAGSDAGTTPPPSTINEFFPEQRPIGDCLNSSLPKPNCGSKARGGWRQTTVFALLVGGLGFIAWRIARQMRSNKLPPAGGSPQ